MLLCVKKLIPGPQSRFLCTACDRASDLTQDRKREHNKKYWEEHKERLSAYRKEWYQNNRLKKSTYASEYRKLKGEKLRWVLVTLK